MSLKKIVKSRRKFKFFLLFMVLALIVLTIVFLLFDEYSYKRIDILNDLPEPKLKINHKIIIPEKYNENIVKSRLIKDKIKFLTQNKDENNGGDGNKLLDELSKDNPQQKISQHIQIFYSAPVSWYKHNSKNTRDNGKSKGSSSLSERILDDNSTVTIVNFSKYINIAFYPLMGLYKSTTEVIEKHFENIKKCGIGVVIVSMGTRITEQLFEIMINTAPIYNLTVTIEITYHQNRSFLNDISEQLTWLRKYYQNDGIYKVFSITKNDLVPLIYIRNAYKMDKNEKFLCPNYSDVKLKKDFMNAVFIGHIKMKQHADLLRRLCFNGFYTKIPSNGATFASTWKNWSYLKTFAQTYKMLFVPTVGPGYAERNKPPRHGNIQRLRSNGRYYGVAWRTAISNHIGFINIASYNSWQEGTQIEEAVSHDGFMDYSPGKPNKYLELTTHWIQNFLKTEKPTKNCHELFNNTIC